MWLVASLVVLVGILFAGYYTGIELPFVGITFRSADKLDWLPSFHLASGDNAGSRQHSMFPAPNTSLALRPWVKTSMQRGQLEKQTSDLMRTHWLRDTSLWQTVLLIPLLLFAAFLGRALFNFLRLRAPAFCYSGKATARTGSCRRSRIKDDGPTTASRSLSPFTASRRKPNFNLSASGNAPRIQSNDDEECFPRPPRTLRDCIIGSGAVEPWRHGMRHHEESESSSSDSARSFSSSAQSETAFQTARDNAAVRSASRDCLDEAAEALRRQVAAARMIQRWWLTTLRRRSGGSGLRTRAEATRPVPEHSLDEDFEAVFPVAADYPETAANVTWIPGQGSSDCEISTGWEAQYTPRNDAEVEERAAERCTDVLRVHGHNVEQHYAKTPESSVPETDRCWSSEESAYALLPATGPSPAASSSSAFPPLTSPGGQNTRDTVGSGASEQLVVHMPYPLSPVPVGQLLPGPSSERVFGELLGECKHRVPLTFHAMLHDITLRKVTKNSKHNAAGFSELRAVYAVWDKFPDIMANACINYHSRKAFSLFSDEERELSRPYVVLHMSFAGRPISKVKFASALQLRSAVQQVALTLAVGEAALEFEHRALTTAHVLVKEAHEQVASFWLDGRALFVDTVGVQLSLVDFSAARLLPLGEEAGSQPVFADLTKIPLHKREALGDTFRNVCQEISEDLSSFHPWTNVAYLEALTRALVGAYEARFADAADETERQAWRDVCFWLAEMPHCSAVREFALELVAQSTRSTTSLSTI
ncbi:uncharacterized protein LOC144123021 isoform X2 [Amblyomma americanum]